MIDKGLNAWLRISIHMGIEELMLNRAKKQGIQKGLQTRKKEGLKEGERK